MPSTRTPHKTSFANQVATVLCSCWVGATEITNNLQTETELWFAPLESVWRSSIRTQARPVTAREIVVSNFYTNLQKATTLPPKAHPDFITRFSAYRSRESFVPDERYKTSLLAVFLLLLFIELFAALQLLTMSLVVGYIICDPFRKKSA